jgi:nucleotide-binding universal stress UspA family protein
MFRKILVPTDGSRYALRAAEYAADLARRYQAEVTLLAAFDLQAVRASGVDAGVQAGVEQSMREASTAALAETAAILEAAGVVPRRVEVEGAPGYAIAREATDGDYDLVVMGSRGLGLSEADLRVLGSVTDRVLRMVSCAVLTVKV